MSELLPCPFCGSTAEEDFFPNALPNAHRVTCSVLGCPARLGWIYETEAEAVSAWNRRILRGAAAPLEPK